MALALRGRLRRLSSWPLVVSASLVLVALLQRPGRTTFDTKLDLVLNPGRFLAQSLYPWTPDMHLGSLQNQASGYLFPIGPFFWLGDAIGIPAWLWQRVWTGLVLVVAFEGARRLIVSWQPGSPRAGLIGGLAYAFSPRVLSTVGVLSGETLPGAVLPWAVLPLVLADRGRLQWRRAVILSAAAIPFMGGQNATEVLYLLPAPAMVILWSAGNWRSRLQRLGAWCVLITLTCIWWIGPLIVLKAYGAPFLDHIESASVTTQPIGWLEAMRGASHWVAYLPSAITDWEAGHQFVASTPLIAATFVLTLGGLVGLATVVTERRSLLVVLLLGSVVVLTIGHGGPAGSPLAEQVRMLLDGPAAPFRNVHKIDPLARLPLALGLGILLDRLAARPPGFPVRGRMSHRHGWLEHAPRATATLMVLSIVASGSVLLTGATRSAHGWERLSASWSRMIPVLRELPEHSRVLLVPSAPALRQTWGRTVDEVIQTVEDVGWTSRSQIPLIPAGGLRLLDSLESMVVSGRPTEELAPLLRRLGVTHVLVRGDLVRSDDVPSAARAWAAVSGSPGLVEVKTLGDIGAGVPELSLFATTSPGSVATVAPMSEVLTWLGTPEALGPMAFSGVGPTPLVPAEANGAPDVVTDTPQRRERSFGRIHDAYSETFATSDDPLGARRVHDVLPDGITALEAVTDGINRVDVSSSASHVDVLGPLHPDLQPWAAVDGTWLTSWASAPFTNPVGQSWSMEFARPRTFGPVTVVFDPLGARVTTVRMVTDAGSSSVRVGADGIARFAGSRRSARVEFVVSGVRSGSVGQVKIAEILGLGSLPDRAVALPAAPPTAMIQLHTSAGRRPCAATPEGLECETAAMRGPDEPWGMARRVTLDAAGDYAVSGAVVAADGTATDALFDPPGHGIRVRASSSLASDPGVGAWAASDGDPRSAWVSAAGDLSPWVSLSWDEQRELSRVVLGKGEWLPGRAPTVVAVSVDGTRVPFTDLGQVIELAAPVTGRELRLDFEPSSTSLVIGEVSVAGLEDLVYHPVAGAQTGAVCGLGPSVAIGGRLHATKVVGTLDDVRRGRELRLVLCSDDISLAAGATDIHAQPAGGFVVTQLTLQPKGDQEPPATGRGLALGSWGAGRRQLEAPAGPAALLRVAENFNAGWEARVDGQVLTPVVVDGWAQGWLLPAGAARTVDLRFVPTAPYRLSLFIGLLTAGGVVASAVVLLVRPRRRDTVHLGEGTRGGPQLTPALGVSGAVALAAVTGLAGGPVVAAGLVIGLLLRHRRDLLLATGVLLFCLSLALRIVQSPSTVWTAPQDVAAAASFGLICGISLLPNPEGRRRR